MLFFLAGIAWWSLLEYLLHRFAFHTENPLFGRRHKLHHAKTEVPALAIAPVASMLGGAALNALGLCALCGWRSGGLVLAGMLAGYAAYEVTHYAVHYWKFENGLFRALKRYHLSHHFQAPHARYGVTSPLWDLVFGTFRMPVRKRKTAPVEG